jgi:hypothetical protein
MLLPTADIHTGSVMNKSITVRMNDVRGDSQKLRPARYCSVVGMSSGAIGVVAPVDEDAYLRLTALQHAMVSALPHTLGLNPLAYRKFKPKYKVLRPQTKGILDGEFLIRYANLDAAHQRELAKIIGVTADQLLDDLLQFDHSVAFF